MNSLFNAIRDHWHFLFVVAILIAVMTWPTIVYVFRTDVSWLPIDSGDIWIEFWNAWYGRLVLSGEAGVFHTSLSFFPEGMSLAYQNFNVVHMLVFGALQTVLPSASAYNLLYLLIIFSGTLAAYIYLLHLIDDKWIALFGAVVFGCSGYIVGRPMHPNAATLAPLPLSLYLVHLAFQEKRRLLALLAGLTIGLTAFVALYVFVCLLITVVVYCLYLLVKYDRDRRAWVNISLIFGVVAVFGIVRVFPMLSDSSALDDVLDKSGGVEEENDLLQYFINYENPVFNRLITNRVTSAIIQLPDPGRWNTSYLGYVPLVLVGLALLKADCRKQMLPWLLLFAGFFFLRLGSVLTINGHEVTGFLLPKHFLDEIVPVVFEAFYSTDHFQIGILFPFAVLSCFGLQQLLRRVPTSRRSLCVLVLVALMAAEYYRSPEPPRIVTDEETAFLDWLKAEEDQEIRLINLPMNRGNSKQYLFYQTLSGYPQVEGLATRTPPEAYHYIRSNLVLNTWLNKESIVCDAANRNEYLSAVGQFVDDGFTHIILHYHQIREEKIATSFAAIEPSYQDDSVAIFRLLDLQASCP